MTVHHDKDLFSKIRSSYLWNIDEESTNKIVDKPRPDSNASNGFLRATSPRFGTPIERSQTLPSKPRPSKEATATSLSEMHLKPVETMKPSTPPASSTLIKEDLEEPLLASKSPSKHARFAFLAKSGNTICQVRWTTIALIGLILALCGIVTGVLLGINLKSPNTTTSTTTITPKVVTTTSTTSTTSTTITTTTPPATEWIPINYYTSCSSTCISVSTVTPSTLIASWTFEENTNDVSLNGNDGVIDNGAAFTTGYIGQAIELRNTNGQYVNVSYINLVNQAFTVEAWIQLYTLSTTSDIGIVGECENHTIDHCLHYTVRGNKLYFGFFGDDLPGTTVLTTYTWYHVAFVYDYSLNVKYLYLNGVLDGTSAASGATPAKGPFLATSGTFTIGLALPPSTYWDGLLDQVTISNRVKTACEILNDASLVAYFPFDGNDNDIGPNSMSGTSNTQSNNGLSWVTGQVNQALNFNSSNSYFQSCGFYALGKNQPFSIAMWVNPTFPGGTLLHISSAGTGSGGWCLPMIGFSLNGSIVVQTWNGSNAIEVLGPILPINSWTHIVQTYSSTNGLRLYLNGGLYNSVPLNTYGSSNVPMCILLGSSGLGRNCQTASISMGQYAGAIYEFYVYNRELNSVEACPLAHP